MGSNLAATSAESGTGATVPFCTSSPSQSWAPTMTSGPLPTLVASLNCERVSVDHLDRDLDAVLLAELVGVRLHGRGARSASVQMTRSTLASRTGAARGRVGDAAAGAVALVAAEGAGVLYAVGVEDPPQALRNRAATPVTAAAPIARLCMEVSPWRPGPALAGPSVPKCSKKLQRSRFLAGNCSTFLQPFGRDQPGPGRRDSGRTPSGAQGRSWVTTALHALDTDVGRAATPLQRIVRHVPAGEGRHDAMATVTFDKATRHLPGHRPAPRSTSSTSRSPTASSSSSSVPPAAASPPRLRMLAGLEDVNGGRDPHRRPRRHPPVPRRTATSRWCSRTTRSTRT